MPINQKLGEWMDSGAAETLETRGQYLDRVDGWVYACAFGCAMYASNGTLRKMYAQNAFRVVPDFSKMYLDLVHRLGYDPAHEMISRYSLPPHVAMLIDEKKPQGWTVEKTMSLFSIITTISDFLGRAVAILYTKQLGY
jgi:hypothetical protein